MAGATYRPTRVYLGVQAKRDYIGPYAAVASDALPAYRSGVKRLP